MAEASLPDARWFAEMAHGSRLVFFAMRIAPDVAYEFISDAIRDLVGVSAAEAMSDPDAVYQRVDPGSRDDFARALATTPGEQITVELKWQHVEGRPLYTRCWARARERTDNSVVLEGTVAEITELREVEAVLRNSEQRHRLLAENAWDVIWTMAMDGTITYVSPAVERVRGITPAEAAVQTLAEIHPPESGAVVNGYYQQVFEAVAAGTEPPTFRGEMEYFRKDGSVMTGELQVIPHIDTDGRVVELLGVTRDISERKILEGELIRLATTDPVTGVCNRRHGTQLLAAETARSDRGAQRFSVLMVDIDNFKSINDTYGHQVGDRVLVEVAQRLTAAVRRTDLVVRWGGEEFVVMLRDCSPQDALERAEEIRRAIADTPFQVAGTVTASIGTASLASEEDLDSWLGRADSALYQAKRAGRNTVAAG